MALSEVKYFISTYTPVTQPATGLLSVLLFSLLLSVPNVEAERNQFSRLAKEGTKQVTITVRKVRAATGKKKKLAVDNGIKDLSSKLQKLPFTRFKLLSTYSEIVPVANRRTISIGEGHNLTLRPLYIDGKKVGMWLRWQDHSGMKLLDTRMHLTSGESMITGTDAAAGSGVILAIDVEPK